MRINWIVKTDHRNTTMEMGAHKPWHSILQKTVGKRTHLAQNEHVFTIKYMLIYSMLVLFCLTYVSVYLYNILETTNDNTIILFISTALPLMCAINNSYHTYVYLENGIPSNRNNNIFPFNASIATIARLKNDRFIVRHFQLQFSRFW